MNPKHTRNTRPSLTTLLTAGSMLAALCAQAAALDFTPDASRLLSDPAYLPQQGQYYGQTAYAYGRSTGDVYDYLGAPNRSFTTTSNTLSQLLAYGYSDALSIRVSAAYAQNNTRNQYTAGTSTSSNSSGFTDPVVGMTWRMLDQSKHAVSWDLIASYMPDMIQAVGASPTQDGSVARGGQVATVGTAVSYKTRDFTLYLDATASYLGKRSILNANGTTTSYAANRQYALGVNTQTRLGDKFAFNLGAARTFNNNVNATNDTTLVTFTSMPGDVNSINAALVYQINPNKLVASLTYNHDIRSNSSVSYPTAPNSSTTTQNGKADTLGARLQYVF